MSSSLAPAAGTSRSKSGASSNPLTPGRKIWYPFTSKRRELMRLDKPHKVRKMGRLLAACAQTGRERDAANMAIERPEALLGHPSILSEWIEVYNVATLRANGK